MAGAREELDAMLKAKSLEQTKPCGLVVFPARVIGRVLREEDTGLAAYGDARFGILGVETDASTADLRSAASIAARHVDTLKNSGAIAAFSGRPVRRHRSVVLAVCNLTLGGIGGAVGGAEWGASATPSVRIATNN